MAEAESGARTTGQVPLPPGEGARRAGEGTRNPVFPLTCCGFAAPRMTLRLVSVEDARRLARRRLPKIFFDYIDGGADDEIALRRSTSAFDDIEFMPRSLVDISRPDHSVEIFGQRIPFPLLLSPTGLTALFNREAEKAVARAAGEAGLPYCLSTVGNTTIEDFAAAGAGPSR